MYSRKVVSHVIMNHKGTLEAKCLDNYVDVKQIVPEGDITRVIIDAAPYFFRTKILYISNLYIAKKSGILKTTKTRSAHLPISTRNGAPAPRGLDPEPP